ncbi:amidohydrolase [Devosia sp. 2618]|uniref:amidohydrolase family protein n=1 Tax=Devosia sp. 2618 TaxID=3156454 RepID=UPI0033958E79
MTDLIITNALVVAADGANTVIERGGVAVSNGKISHIASAETLSAMEGQARRVIDASGMLLMPGLINTHCHAADSLFRGLVEDLKLEPWLQTVWKAEAAILNPQTTHLGSVLGFAELLLGGVTTVMDMFWFPGETVRAARDVGVRVSTGGIFFDYPGVNGQSQAQREAIAEAFFEEFGDADDVFPAVLPHGTYTVSPEHLKTAYAIAEKYGGLFCTHVAETVAERADIETRYGRPVVQHLEHHGLINDRSVFAHCVHLDDAEIEILAKRGATVSHNPMSNLKLASGFARVPDMLKAGVNVTLGTDGAISGNDLDMWMALRLAATLHKAVAADAQVVSTREALAMVTINGAKALNAADRIGSLEVGKLADMVLLDLKRPHAVPLFDPLTHLVYSTAKSDVRHVFLGGEQVVRDGVLTHLNIADTLAEVQALVPRIKASIA